MSTQNISPIEAFFQRHQHKPGLYRIIYGIAALCWIYGFALFNVAGYHRATAMGGYYAEMGLFVLALLYLFSGAMLFTIRSRKHDDDFRSPAHAIVFHIKIVALPLLLGFAFSLIVVRCLTIGDSYMELTVKATEPVKKDLKWLLGDLYPEDQEKNIDPETLEWTMVLAETPTTNYMRVLRTNSPKVTPIQREFYSDQLNTQNFEAVWTENGKEIRKSLEIDWSRAEFFGYNQDKRKDSYPICDLRAPLITSLPTDQKDIKVFINNKRPEDHLINPNAFGFHWPAPLPDMMRIENQQLVVRTNYSSGSWAIYCLYNFPENNRQYIPERITSKSIGTLNSSIYKLHFVLFPGIHQSNSVLDYKKHEFVRRSTYEEFFEQMNDIVALQILNTTIYGTGPVDPY